MSEKITFKELIEQISNETKQSQNSTNSFVHELVQIIESGLEKSGSVSISGFGKFELRRMNERKGRNPQTGEEITIPEQNKVVFKPYKKLREDVNRPYAGMTPRVLEDREEESDRDSTEHKEDSSAAAVPSLNVSSPESSKKEEEQNSDRSDDDGEAMLVERSKPKSDAPAKAEQEEKISPFTTSMKDEKDMAETVQKAGNFKWSYAAASIIVAIAFFAILFMMLRPAPTTETAQEQQFVPTDRTAQMQTGTFQQAEPQQETDVGASEPDHPELLTHNIETGESLWNIAENYYDDPYLWPLIYEENRNQIDNPNVVMSGTDLSIPVVEDAKNLTRDESDKVASGYLSLYEWTLSHDSDQARYFLWAVGKFSPEILDRASQQVEPGDLAFAKRR